MVGISELSDIGNWLVLLSEFIFLITLSVSSILAVRTFQLKVKEENRLRESSVIESNTRLFTLFSEMIQIADSRNAPIVSEKVIEELFRNNLINSKDFETSDGNGNFSDVQKKLETAILIPPYGLSTQVATVSGIFTLGKEHPILRDAAIAGLASISLRFKNDKEVTTLIKGYIEEFRSLTRRS